MWNSGQPLDTSSRNTTICMRTRDGVHVAGDFQIAPKDMGGQRSIFSVQRWWTGNRIEFERAGGVYWLRADTRAKTKSETGGVKVLMGFEQDTTDAAEAQPARPGNVPVLPSESQVEPHELTHLLFRNWCKHCVRAKAHTTSRVLAACRSSPQTFCSWGMD